MFKRISTLVRVMRIPFVIAAICAGLALLPGRTHIAPLVESDYVYQLLAADRAVDGHGFTSLQPVAPHQPWEWQYDWGFLTQWPVGYPALVWLARSVTGLSTLVVCGWIGTVASALALVGWYLWIRRSAPRGASGVLLAAVAAGTTVSVGSLVNPSTDAVLVALVPFVLLATRRGIESSTRGPDDEHDDRGASDWIGLAGLGAGGLVWIRYAAIFVPVAIGFFLLCEWRLRRSIRFREMLFFIGGAAGPIAALLLLNYRLGAGPLLSQLNVGQSVGFHFRPSFLTTVWWNFTDVGFYDYHWFSHWTFAIWPVLLIMVALRSGGALKALSSFLDKPDVTLSAIMVASLFAFLIVTTTLFGDKFDYVHLQRYYRPVMPLYFVLFVAPLLLAPRWQVRAMVGMGLLIACQWVARQDWVKPYERQLAAEHVVTPYGQRETCFTPGSAELYKWLRREVGPNVIVVSNFHEYVALETGLPTLPIPEDRAQLNWWVSHISAQRGISEPHVLFVLDSDNRWRDYWIAEPAAVAQTFHLHERIAVPDSPATSVFRYRPPFNVDEVATAGQ